MRPESPLDCAIFQLDEARTRCELWVTAGKETEKLASGSLKPFLAHLKAAQEQIALGQSSISLEAQANSQTIWFTKGTVERFVRFVTTPDVLERVSIVETERRQLEEAINILGDQQQHGTGLEVEELIDEAAAGDGSKNQLLVAMDARRIMLQKEQLSAFSRAAAAGFDAGCMPDLIEFSQYFGAFRFREACLKFAAVYKKMQENGHFLDMDADIVQNAGDDRNTIKSRKTWNTQDNAAVEAFSDSRDKSTQHEPLDTVEDILNASREFTAVANTLSNVLSPSTEGTMQETPPSRRLPRRVSSPRRRSCSPRRVQIGRSSSRRQGMVVIRNINYASPGSGSRSVQPTAADDDSSEESESVRESEDTKDVNHRRLSVQDAISLFERKQRDSLESQASKMDRRSSADTGSSGKSVLKRWGSTGDSSTVGEEGSGDFGEVTSVATTKAQAGIGAAPAGNQERHPKARENDLSNFPRIEERRKSWVTAQQDLEWKFQQLKMQEAALPAVRSSKESTTRSSAASGSKDVVLNPPTPQPTGANMQFGFQYRGQKPSRAAVSRSWSASSEQDLLSMVGQAEANATQDGGARQSQREHGRLYEQYRERRDAKIRQESDSKKAERESKLKAMQEILDKRKAELTAGAGRSTDKANEILKATSSRKGLLQGGRTTSSSRSSPTVSSSSQTTPRAARHLPPEPRSRAARRLSPGPQKPSSGPLPRNATSSPKLPRSTTSSGQRRPSGISDNPLSRSMPSLSELRKENTRPSARTPQALQQSKPALARSSKTAGNTARQRTVSKVLPLESNGVVPSDLPAIKYDTPSKQKTLLTTANETSQILTPLKLLQGQQAVSRIPAPKQVSAVQETKAFLRKGRGIGPGAGPGVMKLKAVSTSDVEEEDKPEEGGANESHELDLPSVTLVEVDSVNIITATTSSFDKPDVPGSVRESQEMDIETSSVDEEHKSGTDNYAVASVPDTVSANDTPVHTEVHHSVQLETPLEWSARDLPVIAPRTTSKLTLIQQIATENYVPDGDQHFTGTPSLPAVGIPVLRRSTSPELDGMNIEKNQRKKWGSSQQKSIPIVTIPQQGIKDSPKGFKRLLKFGRKSRGSGSSNTAEWVSASTTSEGDEDSDVSRDTSAGYGNGGSFLKRSIEAYSRDSDHTGSRSFFSLSNFRSKGGSDSRR